VAGQAMRSHNPGDILILLPASSGFCRASGDSDGQVGNIGCAVLSNNPVAEAQRQPGFLARSCAGNLCQHDTLLIL
jgi:hypothetical protein